MTDTTHQHIESITAHINALESARRSVQSNHTEIYDSVRRIAHSLWSTGNTCGIPEIVFESAALKEAHDEDLPRLLDGLLEKLHALRTGDIPGMMSILIIEDDPTTAGMLKALLTAPNRRIHIATTYHEAFSILREIELSLIILDLHLPDVDGRNFLLHLRSIPGTAMIPVMILTGSSESQAEMECLTLGADIYFQKPYDPETLAVAVASKLQRSADLARMAREDLLTKLPNRAAFSDVFDRTKSLALRRKEPLCVAILDLDRFKLVNDTYGHAMGDMVLRRTALVVKAALRGSDSIARWGGEEFVVLMPNTSPDGGVIAIEKALIAMRGELFRAADGVTFGITFSAGCAEVQPGASVDDAVAEADRLLYMAKEQGRNRVVAAQSESVEV
jgi:diguanylate cyclase (GGDEF)-like protein